MNKYIKSLRFLKQVVHPLTAIAGKKKNKGFFIEIQGHPF